MNRPIYLYITPFFPSPTSWRGGYCLDAVKAIMRTERYDVCIMVPRSCDDYEHEGIHVHCFRRISAPCGFAPFLFSKLNIWLFRHKLKKMGVDLAKVAVLHANTIECALYASDVHSRCPSVVTLVHHHALSPVNLISGRLGIVPIHATLLFLYYRRLCENVDAHVFVSQRSMDTYGKRFKGSPESDLMDIKDSLVIGKFFRPIRLPRGIVLYNGYDASVYYPKKATSHDGFVIGCVANFQPMKDQMTLLRAAKILKTQIKDFKVVFVGSGATLNECKLYVDKNSLTDIVSFRAEMDHHAIADFYRSIDLFVLPSRMEGFCCSFIEAFACGVPIMGCRGVSVEEVIPDEERSFWLCPPCDEKAFAKNILNYYKLRPVQHLSRDMNIDGLFHAFLKTIEGLKSCDDVSGDQTW